MKVKILVPVSGGKDSQAALKLAVEKHGTDVVRGLFCDTQFEHPLTYAHVERLRTMYGVRIDTVCAGSVEAACIKHGRFPGGGARHCTDELKIRPTKVYCRELATEQGEGFEVWYGMRTDESQERASRYAGKVCDELYAPHEVMPSKYPKYLAKLGVMFRLCILDWSEADVMAFVGREHLNPLYAARFPRVGCFPCLASGDKWKAKAFGFDQFGAAQHAKVIAIEAATGKSVWTSKRGKAANDNNQGCMFCAI
jgi:3'-phosphoadenosine 5'-phosphosulfate sulfotransferase (PAPS reductase)/FAD synthetase